MLLSVTPNPAIDRTLIVPGFAAGEVFRASQAITAAGGKGLNVARAARTFGQEVTCAGFIGGYKGQLLESLAAQDGFRGVWTWIEAETRTCVIVIDPQRNQLTTLYEGGPQVSADDWDRLLADIRRVAPEADAVSFSGSLPPGSPTDRFGEIVRELARSGKPTWVDTSGAALACALEARPTGIKVNSAEAGALLKRSLDSVETALAAASELQRRGPASVVLTLGEQGAVMVSEASGWYAQPPAVQAVSAVGSGDVFFAGLLTALLERCSPGDALRRAVAAGAANALTPGGGRFDLGHYHRLLAATTLVSA
jgi:1-phosphofructokinase